MPVPESRSVRKELRLRQSMVDAIEAAQGDVSFNRFVERALEAALEGLGSDQPSWGGNNAAARSTDVAVPSEPASPRASKPFRPVPKGKA